METAPLYGAAHKVIDSGSGDVSFATRMRLEAYFKDDKSGLKLKVACQVLKEASDLPLEDRAILLAIAEHESGFDPLAQNATSSAHGVFQIISSTWRGLGFRENERRDTTAQIKAGVKLYRENLSLLKGGADLHGLKRAIQMYRLHHDGPGPVGLGGEEVARRYVVKKFVAFLNLLRG